MDMKVVLFLLMEDKRITVNFRIFFKEDQDGYDDHISFFDTSKQGYDKLFYFSRYAEEGKNEFPSFCKAREQKTYFSYCLKDAKIHMKSDFLVVKRKSFSCFQCSTKLVPSLGDLFLEFPCPRELQNG
jgi:hypothetical protein